MASLDRGNRPTPLLTLDRTLSQSIVDRAMTIIEGNVNVMDHTGVIIASGEAARLGQLHEGALLALSRKGLVEIDAALAQPLDAVRPGVNLPLSVNGRIVGCIGLTGVYEDYRLTVLVDDLRPGLAGRGIAQAAAGAAGTGKPRPIVERLVGLVRRRHAHGGHRQGAGDPSRHSG